LTHRQQERQVDERVGRCGRALSVGIVEHAVVVKGRQRLKGIEAAVVAQGQREVLQRRLALVLDLQTQLKEKKREGRDRDKKKQNRDSKTQTKDDEEREEEGTGFETRGGDDVETESGEKQAYTTSAMGHVA
jgi:hypothetical protein